MDDELPVPLLIGFIGKLSNRLKATRVLNYMDDVVRSPFRVGNSRLPNVVVSI